MGNSALLSSIEPSFQYNLLQKLIKNQPNDTIVISPLGIHLILSLVANGAENETRDEIIKTLVGENYSINELNKLNKHIIEKYKGVFIANGIFTISSPTQEYISLLKEFNAMVDKLRSPSQVNDWVSQKTRNAIPSVISSIDNIKMLLVNAIYFKGKWVERFKEYDTVNGRFYLSNGGETFCELMKIKTYFDYSENDYCQFIRLDYREELMCSYVILPKENIKINEFINSHFSHKTFQELVDSSSKVEVSLWLPKVEKKCDMKLNSVLKELGIEKGFSAEANFSKITKEIPLKIEDVLQKTFLKINEEGTEAAEISMPFLGVGAGARIKEIIEMKVNHPFIFIITNKDRTAMNGGFLFLSKIECC